MHGCLIVVVVMRMVVSVMGVNYCIVIVVVCW